MPETMTRWDHLMEALREQAYRTMDADPASLLEHDGGPLSLDVDIFMARLVGMDDEVVADWRIPRIEPYLLMPIAPPLRRMVSEADASALPSLSAAKYVLQSGWATTSVSLWLADPPKGVRPRSDGTVKIAFLRYRRRL